MSVQSVDRALAILGVVAKEPLGLVDISNRAGLPLTTTSRLLETLAASNAVSRDDEGAYSPPPPSFRDGGASRPPSEFHTPSKMRDDDDDDDVDSIPVRLVRDIRGRSPAFHDDDDNEMFSDIQDAGGDAFID